MTAATPTGTASALRRAVLLAGILAVIAGFLGMHIFSGSHGAHSQELPPGSAGQAAAAHPAASTSARAATTGHTNHNAGRQAPPPAAAAPVPAMPASVMPASVMPASAMPASVTVGGIQVPPACTCPGGCADKSAVHIDCTPSPAGTSLSAPPPGTTPLAVQSRTAALAVRQADQTYHPGTPSPRDLSISRT